MWLFSDKIEVGYSYHWAALPYEVYSLNASINSMAGITTHLEIPLFNSVTLESSFGVGNATVPQQSIFISNSTSTFAETDVPKLFIASLMIRYEAEAREQFLKSALVRVAALQGELGQGVITSSVALAALGGLSASNFTVLNPSKVAYRNLAFQTVLASGTELTAEYGSADLGNTILGRTSGFYLSGLQWFWRERIGVHITRSKSKDVSSSVLGSSSATTLGLVFPIAKGIKLKGETSDVVKRSNTAQFDEFRTYSLALDFIF